MRFFEIPFSILKILKFIIRLSKFKALFKLIACHNFFATQIFCAVFT